MEKNKTKEVSALISLHKNQKLKRFQDLKNLAPSDEHKSQLLLVNKKSTRCRCFPGYLYFPIKIDFLYCFIKHFFWRHRKRDKIQNRIKCTPPHTHQEQKHKKNLVHFSQLTVWCARMGGRCLAGWGVMIAPLLDSPVAIQTPTGTVQIFYILQLIFHSSKVFVFGRHSNRNNFATNHLFIITSIQY